MRGVKAFIFLVVCDLTGVAAVLVMMEKPAAYLFALWGALAPVGLYLMAFRPFFQAQALEQHGEPAEATVLGLCDTGWTVSLGPQVGLRLEVRPPGDMPFVAKTVASRLIVGQVQPGAVLRVRYDPKDRRRVLVVSGPEVASAGSR